MNSPKEVPSDSQKDDQNRNTTAEAAQRAGPHETQGGDFQHQQEAALLSDVGGIGFITLREIMQCPGGPVPKACGARAVPQDADQRVDAPRLPYCLLPLPRPSPSIALSRGTVLKEGEGPELGAF